MDCVDFDALEAQARAKLPPASYAFAATGADDEISTRENAEAWRALRLRPRMLRDISKIDTSVEVLGARLPAPIIVGPTGRHKLFHPEGECATARGAAAANTVFTLPTHANRLIEDVAAERRAAPQWFQLYMWPNRAEIEAFIDRIAAAGFRALILTVDSPVFGWSPRSSRLPHEPDPEIRNINVPNAPIARTAYDAAFKGKVMFPVTWRELEWLVKRAPMPVMVKGVLRGDDAKRCLELGAKGVIVSNHGGRHLDTTVTTMAALRDVVAGVAGQGEIYVDGGIRRGTDILKALALGARAVLIGRPILWALSVNGAQGVSAVLEHLRTELIRAMALSGTPTLADATPDLIAS
ncbi:MAG TPA: alpha-hydroxy acid oxidase [Pseudolabrys sp.]|nr:alpha-hydroxy acid oxidase [Pseudolabrys sp.]